MYVWNEYNSGRSLINGYSRTQENINIYDHLRDDVECFTNVTILDIWLGLVKFQTGTTISGKTLEENLQNHEIDTK